MTSWYVATVSFHHRNERNPWEFNFEAKNGREALAKAFRDAIIEEYGLHEESWKLKLEDFMSINDKKELAIKHPEGDGYIVMWNIPPNKKLREKERNVGFGVAEKPSSDSTYRGDNCWLKLELRTKRQKTLARAIKGYAHKLEKLPVDVLAAFLHRLDRLED